MQKKIPRKQTKLTSLFLLPYDELINTDTERSSSRSSKTINIMPQERWKFIHPFTARFVGPTACGKTTFLKKVIEQKLIYPWPQRIIYFYGSTWQSGSFDYLQSVHNVHFVKGFDDSLIAENDANANTLIICDDLILEMKDSDAAANLFMRGSHHLNMSVILIEQNLYPRGRQSVSMKTNTHYLVIFKSPADALGVSTLAKQMFPQQRGRFLIDAYHDCTLQPFSYLIIDSKQSTPDEIRLISNITDEKSHPVVYVRNQRNVLNEVRKFNQKEISSSNSSIAQAEDHNKHQQPQRYLQKTLFI